MYLATIVLSAISGFFYRLGGSADKPKWFFKARDLWCGLCVVAWLSLYGISHWALIPCVGLMWASLSSYFNKRGADEHWWNYALHGFFIGFSLLPLSLSLQLSWDVMFYRSVALAALMALWSLHKNDVVEEAGRGVFIITTLLILGV